MSSFTASYIAANLKTKGETLKNVLVTLFRAITKKMGTGAFKPENEMQKHPSKKTNIPI